MSFPPLSFQMGQPGFTPGSHTKEKSPTRVTGRKTDEPALSSFLGKDDLGSVLPVFLMLRTTLRPRGDHTSKWPTSQFPTLGRAGARAIACQQEPIFSFNHLPRKTVSLPSALQPIVVLRLVFLPKRFFPAPGLFDPGAVFVPISQGATPALSALHLDPRKGDPSRFRSSGSQDRPRLSPIGTVL